MADSRNGRARAGRLWLEVKKNLADRPLMTSASACYWMLTILLFYSPAFLAFDSPLTYSGSMFTAGTVILVASVAIYSSIAGCSNHVQRMEAKAWFPYLLCAVLSIGVLGYLMGTTADLPEGESFACFSGGSALIAVGMAFICVEAGRFYGYLGARKVFFYETIGLLQGTLGAFVVSLLPQTAKTVVLVLASFVMVFCLWKTLGTLPLGTVFQQGVGRKRLVPWKFLVTSLLQGLAIGLMHNLPAALPGSTPALSTVGFLCGIALLFVAAEIVELDFNTLFYRIGFPLMAIGFFLAGTFGNALSLGGVALDAGYGYQYLVSCALCAYLARHFDQSPAWIISVSTGCLLGGQLVGEGIVKLGLDNAQIASSCAVLLLLSALVLLSNRDVESGWGSMRPGKEAPVSEPATRACAALAAQYGLSKREVDVVLLIAKGHTRKSIGGELHLAEETVKTHVANIYQKLLIHSKQELVDMLERMEKQMELQ